MAKFIKFNSWLLSFAILICSLFSVTIFVNAEIIKMGVITEPGDNKVGIIVRADATTTSSKIANVADKTVVTVIAQKNDTQKTKNPDTGKVYIWYQISYTSSGKNITGYVRENYITVTEYDTDPSFEKQLADFPESYHDDLIKLHALYPNWIFRADKIDLTFTKAITLEAQYPRKQVSPSAKNSWRSMEKNWYNWDENTYATTNGGWYGASSEVIAYYMDPRNFLNANDIYMYMQQKYDANTQTEAGVLEIIDGTFLDAKITDKNDEYYNKTYAKAIMQAAKESSVNPYVLASTIIQEQGTKGATLSKGTTYKDTTVYNFFNWKASGSTEAAVISNGAAYAYSQGWTTPSKSIIGGAKMYGSGYIADGQDTYFYKNYNIIDPDNIWHQYAQNVSDSLSSSKHLIEMYSDKTEINLTFRIPVYKSLPSSVSALPTKSDKKNNYYFSDIEVDGLTPSFSRYTYEYDLSISDNTSVYVELPSGASLSGTTSHTLKKGDNEVKLVVKSQTGYKRNYTINVNASKACTLTVTTDKNSQPEDTETKIINGDTNGDGKVTLTDLARIRLHLLKKLTLKNDNATGADTNDDGKISLTDLARVRLHLLGKIKL